MTDRAHRAEHYRSKAEEARVIADSMKDAECKEYLMTVSADYIMLANMLDRSGMSDPLPASE
jgi:hypothetical protein